MGAYTNVRGWIQIPVELKLRVKSLIARSPSKALLFDLKADVAEWYTTGWVVQDEAINGALFAFFGAEIRTETVKFIHAQVLEIALLNYADAKNEYLLEPEGVFYLDEDGTHGSPPLQWLVGRGKVLESER